MLTATGRSPLIATDKFKDSFSVQEQPDGTLSFFGQVQTAQPVVPLTTPNVQQVIDALVNLGLVAQHD